MTDETSSAATSKPTFETPTPVAPVVAATTGGYEYYEEEHFDSEFDSDEEFGSRKKKKKGKQPKVNFLINLLF
jgi:hypothetical protein